MKKLRAKFKKEGDLIYISHLDLMRMFQRAFRRADIPVKYSEGFNPHPRFSLATALGIGISSSGEYMDIELDSYISADEFINRMNRVLPKGAEILKASYIQDKDSLMSLVCWSSYALKFTVSNSLIKDEIEREIENFLNRKEILMVKTKKKRNKIINKEINVRDFIKDMILLMYEDNRGVLRTTLKTGSKGNLKPSDLIKLLNDFTSLNIIDDSIKIHRLELFIEKDGRIITPL
jgi:radical SAM-linked protein